MTISVCKVYYSLFKILSYEPKENHMQMFKTDKFCQIWIEESFVL